MTPKEELDRLLNLEVELKKEIYSTEILIDELISDHYIFIDKKLSSNDKRIILKYFFNRIKSLELNLEGIEKDKFNNDAYKEEIFNIIK